MSKIWTVRGISDDIQKRASEAAQAVGMRLGPWVERVLLDALARPAGQGAPSGRKGGDDLAALVAELVERVGRLEALQVPPAIPGRSSGDVAEGRVPPAIPSRQGRTPDAVEPAEGAKVPAKAEPHPGPAGAAGEPLVAGGSGTRRRLTAAGVAEVERLIEAGVGDAEIAGRLGMDRAAIRQRRLKRVKAGQTSESGSRQGAGEELTTAQILQMTDEAERALRPIEQIQRVSEMQKAGRSDVEIAEFLKGGREEPGDQEPDQGS